MARQGARAGRGPSPILTTASALIGEVSERMVTRDSRFQHSFEVAVDDIIPNAHQPRGTFDGQDIAGLAATMAAEGQLQPVLVRRNPTGAGQAHWILVAGERRWRAARLNGWRTILAIEHTGDPEIATLLENLQRVDLGPVEEARALRRLIAEKGWTQDRAAVAIGKSKGEVSGLLGILSLPEQVLEGVLTSELRIARNALVELARLAPGPLRERLLRQARDGDLTVRQIRAARAEPETSAGQPTLHDGEVRDDGVRDDGAGPLRKLGGWARQLRTWRLAGGVPSPRERDDLRRLVREIEALLERAKAD